MPSQAASLRPIERQLISAQVVAASGASAVFDIPNDLVEMQLILEATAVSGTAPTVDAVLQHSPDALQQKWFGTGNIFTQLTAAAQARAISLSRQRHAGQAAAEYNAAAVSGAAAVNGPLARKCRLFFTLGGSASPTVTVNLWLIANPPATV